MDVVKHVKEIVDVLNKINRSILNNFATPAYSEIPAGAIDGSNTVFTLANTPATGSLQLFLNGMYQTGGAEDYTLAGLTITFVNPPLTGSGLIGFYYH